ncbi:MAG: flippase-like domain-containing protein [Gemmatimonadetes bacterium]|nr:flippase-like domain-containing protein [Gemmatimonadota bacterium]MBT6145997.1 flippase-like domain-containing protein [Gemmatimonadota bacterium]MBT7860767.1 flippase-like domain-containing protein [Gemmatimonadota bacterium]
MKILRLILPGLGLLLLGYLVGTLGLGEILGNLTVMKWAFPLVLLLATGWHVTNTIAWSFAFPSGAFRPPLTTLIRAKLAGEAVNQLTPLANLGGEPLKAFLLRQQSPTSRGLASVVINKTAQVFTGLAFTAIGLLLVVLHWELPQALPVPVQGGLLLLFAIGTLLLWAIVRKQRHMFTSLLRFLKRFGLRPEALESRMTKAGRIDENISRFYSESKGRFCLVMLFHAFGWMLGACETYVILRALGATIEFDVAFLITSLTLLINSLFFFMPSNIGVLEGGQVFLFITLGLNPAMGLSLGIIKRMRKIFWIGLGWLFLTQLSRSLGSLGNFVASDESDMRLAVRDAG